MENWAPNSLERGGAHGSNGGVYNVVHAKNEVTPGFHSTSMTSLFLFFGNELTTTPFSQTMIK